MLSAQGRALPPVLRHRPQGLGGALAPSASTRILPLRTALRLANLRLSAVGDGEFA